MFSYLPDFLPSSIILIGAGGTGSRLMPMMSQLVRTCMRHFNPNAWLEKLPIYVIDGDVVEEKNLLRQNFISKDVGQPKASVVATRYGTAFGIDIYPSIEFIKDDINEINFLGLTDTTPRFTFNGSVVILAVDSAEARRLILRKIVNGNGQSLSSTAKCFIIDAGNEDAFGQVKFFTLNPIIMETPTFPVPMPNQFPVEYKVNYIPFDANYYLNLGSSSQELSCADLPQTLAINAMMATLICTVLQNFLYLKPMTFDGIRFSMNGSMTTEYNTPKRWLQRVELPDLSISRKLGIRVGSTSSFYGLSKDILKIDGAFVKIQKEAAAFYKKAGMIITASGDLERDPEAVAREADFARIAALKKEREEREKLKAQEAELKAKTENVSVSGSIEGVPPLRIVESGTEVSIPDSIPALVPVRSTGSNPRPRTRTRAAGNNIPGVTPAPELAIQHFGPVIANPESIVAINIT